MGRLRKVAAVTWVLLGAPSWLAAQGPAGPTAPGGTTRGTLTLTGTIYDPLGRPAEDTIVTLIGTNDLETAQARSDRGGHYRFERLHPGRYGLSTPVTDLVDPSTVELRAQETTVDVHTSVDEPAIDLRVCRRCQPSPTAAAIGVGAVAAVEGLVQSAQPAGGWELFNAVVHPYPEALEGTEVQGTVGVEAYIKRDGSTADAYIVGSTDPRLEDAALALVERLRWRPALVRAVPIEVPLHATVEFSLSGDDPR